MSAEAKDITIAGLVRLIDENGERIRTLEAENARLTGDLEMARSQRDTANGKVSQYERRGW